MKLNISETDVKLVFTVNSVRLHVERERQVFKITKEDFHVRKRSGLYCKINIQGKSKKEFGRE